MHRLSGLLGLVVFAGCVTINVYFPAAAAEQAADRFIQDVLGEAVDEHGAELKPQVQPDPDTAGSSTVEPLHWSLRGLAGVLDLVVSEAHAQQADIDINTPQINTIKRRMENRLQNQLRPYFESGALGFTVDGMIAIRDRAAVPLSERRALENLVAEDNRDRAAVYREIAVANGHPEWEEQIRATFARRWIGNAPGGWYYQDSSGGWVQK